MDCMKADMCKRKVNVEVTGDRDKGVDRRRIYTMSTLNNEKRIKKDGA